MIFLEPLMSSGKAELAKPARPILVVDDDADTRSAMTDLLEQAGYPTVVASNGDAAMAWLRSNPAPAAILLDLFMPVMNGWQLVRGVRSIEALATVPIVLVTAQGPHWGYPVEEVVRKPVDADQLLATLERLLGGDRGIAA
jgi:CheY-like chemotaxis protein